ncbi:tRNA (adenine(37)-N6)-methyltransferase-like [Anneissia japonica]|uniref:tRNA (adenine(37)-N6)-methyltransferase-like n=1 Tax=Anneissia japonica TaxID=1529436 RepID=UPI00142564AB|nr:tRNA (adenine(37)-N6)-methyltransferase-like [Anneissia japonica]
MDTDAMQLQQRASIFPLQPIGHLRSCFKSKNGTPRQPSVCSFAKARLQISKSVFVHPEHSLEGLASFSHVWVLFAFHDNGPLTSFTKAKVKPPRLDGGKTGLYSTRSPHRPNPIGLSLAKLDKVQGDTIFLSGIDIIDNTPILDIKPYVPMYDRPEEAFRAAELPRLDQEIGNYQSTHAEQDANSKQDLSKHLLPIDQVNYDDSAATNDAIEVSNLQYHEGTRLERTRARGTRPEGAKLEGASPERSVKDVRVPEWITSPPIKELYVRFTPSAEKQLNSFINSSLTKHSNGSKDEYVLEFFSSAQEAKEAITNILTADPRSSYRRNTCQDKLYYFTVDNIHVTAWFRDNFAEVLQVQPEFKHLGSFS